jgi:hypothetical protein
MERAPQRRRGANRRSGSAPGAQITRSKPPSGDSWRTAIRAAETALVVAFWIGAVTSSDVVVAFGLTAFGLIIGSFACLADPYKARKAKLLLEVALLFITLLVGAVIFWRHQATEDLSPAILDKVTKIDKQDATDESILQRSHRLGRLEESYPGFFYATSIRIDDVVAQRNNQFFYFEEPSGANVMLFMNGIGTLYFRVKDTQGLYYMVLVRQGRDGIPLGREVKLICEAGTATNYSFLRVYLNKHVIAEEVYEAPMDFGTRKWWYHNGIIGPAPGSGAVSPQMAQVYMITGSVTPTDDQIDIVDGP